jgi:hypothetical protein
VLGGVGVRKRECKKWGFKKRTNPNGIVVRKNIELILIILVVLLGLVKKCKQTQKPSCCHHYIQIYIFKFFIYHGNLRIYNYTSIAQAM